MSDLCTYVRSFDHPVHVVFFDVKKAFDRVHIPKLILKLLSKDVPLILTRWIFKYMTNRTARVGQAEYELRNGIPQGSVISPLLFQIYVSDVLVDLPVGFVGSYADDFAIAHGVTRNQRAKSWCDLRIQTELNRALRLVHEKCKQIGVELDPSKTKAMWLRRTRYHIRPSPLKLRLGPRALEYVTHYKYLGVLLDNRLTMADFIKQKINGVRLRTQFIVRLRGLSRRAKRCLWRGYVESYMFYGLSQVYEFLSKTVKNRVKGVYYTAMRQLAGVLRCCPREISLREAGMRSLETRIEELNSLEPLDYAQRAARDSQYATACDYRPSKDAWHVEMTFARWRSGYVYLNALKHKHNLLPHSHCRLCRTHDETMEHILFQCNRVDPLLRWRLVTTARQVYALGLSETCTLEHIVGLLPGLGAGKRRTKRLWKLMTSLSTFLDELGIMA